MGAHRTKTIQRMSTPEEYVCARAVAKDCVEWLQGQFGDVLTVTEPVNKRVNGVPMYHEITYNESYPGAPKVMVGACDYSNIVRVVVHPRAHVTLEYLQPNMEYEAVEPVGRRLIAKLDRGNSDPNGETLFRLWRGELDVAPGGKCLIGYYAAEKPAYIKVILRSVLGLDNSHEYELVSEMLTPPHC